MAFYFRCAHWAQMDIAGERLAVLALVALIQKSMLPKENLPGGFGGSRFWWREPPRSFRPCPLNRALGPS